MTRQQLIRSIQVSKQVSERTNESLCNDKINANLLILLACTYVIYYIRTVKSSILQQIDLLPNQQVQQKKKLKQKGKQMERKKR